MIATETLSAWIQSVQGTYINADGAYGAQCWDLSAHWAQWIGKPVINTGGAGRWPGWAGNMVDAFPQTPEIAAAYDLIGPDQQGEQGDHVIWGDSYWYYPATHVAVLIADKGNQLQCMSQNSTPSRADNPYPGQSSGPTTIQSLPRQGLIGFIRPRSGIQFQSSPTISTTTSSEEDFMGGTIDSQQAEDIAQRAADLVFEKLDNRLRINAVQAESIVQATTERTAVAVDAKANGRTIDPQQADDIARAAAQYNQESDANLYGKESK